MKRIGNRGKRFQETKTDERFQYVVLRVHEKYNRREKKRTDDGVWLSLARAPGLGPGGRRFESCHPDSKKYARVAQLVEHDLAKVGAAGSSPVSRS